jgi:glucose/arabinose dehydrogenase
VSHKRKVFVFIVLLVLAVIFAVVFSHSDSKNQETTTNLNTGSSNPTSTSAQSQQSEITLHAVLVSLSSGKKFSLNIPEKYSLSVAAQSFRHARFMALSPDGRLFLGDMTSASDTNTGKVYVLSDFDERSGTFKTQKVYLNNLRNPNSVEFYTDSSGQSWLYIALTDKLIRYLYSAGDNAPTQSPQTVAIFPDTPHNPPQGYWHITRTVVIQNNKLYVSVGSSCDLCEEIDSPRAVILSMDPDGGNLKVIASGLRNAVGLVVVDNDLFATVNESDKLGNDRPNDVVYKIVEGANYGWPYCYEYNETVYQTDPAKWTKKFDCSKVPVAWNAFAAHAAPLGLEYFSKSFADQTIQNSLLVALHGSGDVKIGNGNSVVMVRESSKPVDFISGFIQNGKRLARPVDVLKYNGNSFFISDDFNGVLYYLNYHS